MKRGEILRARCTKREKSVLHAIAAAEALGLSEALRLLVRTEAKRRGLWDPEAANQAQSQSASNVG